MLSLVTTAALAAEGNPIEDRRVQATLHGGAAAYLPFGFATLGAEVGVRVAGGVHVVAGVDLYGTNRVLPPEAQLETGVYSEWNWMQPLHLGGMYKLAVGPVEPFGALDALAVNYYRDEDVNAWALGLRGRAGVDWFFVEHVGLHADVSGGGWGGGNSWSAIDSRAEDAGVVFGGSVGVIAGF